MKKKVGIVGVARTSYGKRPEAHLQDLSFEAVQKVLEQTGLRFTEDGSGIDATVSCSQDHWDGWTISSKNAIDGAGGHLRTEEKVAADGAYALYYAVLCILSGHHDCILIIAHTKESQVDGRLIENTGIEPMYGRMLGLDFTTCAALQARRYIDERGITPTQCARVVVKNRKNAMGNPAAPVSEILTEDDVLTAPILADPIRVPEAKPVADGACAVIVATEEKALQWTDRPVWVKGMGCCYDRHYPGYRDLIDPLALRKAATMAYGMAGVSDPRKEVDLVELSEYFAYQELLWCEGLGLCPEGEGGKLVDSGATGPGGDIPVNPSGGLLAGVPVNVAGLDRAVEAALQLRAEAEERQVEGARTALVHGTGGACGQMHCVLVLGR
ncbi:MAG: thiolase family protein [Deltaproteobacteria bacterium]|nr:thiolase family protein [Deltaproteobacteria bacterium]